MHDPTIQSLNERAIELRAAGRPREAVAVFSEGIVRFPNAAVLYNNLAMTLDEMGSSKEALLAYDSALARAPKFTAALIGRATILLRDGMLKESREAFERALDVEPDSVAANLGMYELLQIAGDVPNAVAHQRRVLERQRLFGQTAPGVARTLLVLCAPGDWQANVPVDFLFDAATTGTYKLFLTETQTPPQTLPAYDVIFNAIADSEDATTILRAAREFIDAEKKPYVNAPERVPELGRRKLARTLSSVDAAVPAIAEVERTALSDSRLPFDYPLIVRPVGSHAGRDLARLSSPSEAAAYAAGTRAERFFVSPFVDYAGTDGYYRKYRIVFVAGEPFPVHLAISREWMIHYYNAPMAEHAWMRAEEERFLADPSSVLGDRAYGSLSAMAKAADLDYFGIDCSIGADGRLLVFEADTAMLVHTTDSAELFPYKRQYVPRIYRALERMIDARKAADT